MDLSSWCGNSSNGDSSIPSSCVCYTIQFIPCSIYILFSIFIICRFRKEVCLISLDPHSQQCVNLIAFLCLVMSLVIAATFLFEVTSLALIVSIVIQCVTWPLLAFTIFFEGWYLKSWPTIYTKVFLFLNLIFSIATTRSFYHTPDDANLELLIEISVKFILNLVILLLALFKDAWRDWAEEQEKFSTDSASHSHHSYAISEYSTHSEAYSGDQKPMSISMRIFTSLGLLKSPSTSKGRYSALQSAFESGMKENENDEEADLLYDRRGLEGGSSRKSGWMGQADEPLLMDSTFHGSGRERERSDSSRDSRGQWNVQVPLVQSALEKHSQLSDRNSQSSSSGKRLSGYFSSFFGVNGNDSDTSFLPSDLNFQGKNLNSSLPNPQEPSSPSHSPTSSTQSQSALQRALSSQLSKRSHSSSTNLAPRGKWTHSLTGKSGGESSLGRDAGSVLRDGSSGTDSSGLDSEDVVVIVQRWGARRAKPIDISSVVSNSSSSEMTIGSASTIPSQKQEIEFEISLSYSQGSSVGESVSGGLSAGFDESGHGSSSSSSNRKKDANLLSSSSSDLSLSYSSSSSSSSSSSMDDGSSRPDLDHSGFSSSRPTGVDLVVWRTAGEILLLHAGLMSEFGDLAPRRPKLRSFDTTGLVSTSTSLSSSSLSTSSSVSTTNSSHFISSSDLSHDVRTISVYLKAVVKGFAFFQSNSLKNFFDMKQPGDSYDESCQLVRFPFLGTQHQLYLKQQQKLLQSHPQKQQQQQQQQLSTSFEKEDLERQEREFYPISSEKFIDGEENEELASSSNTNNPSSTQFSLHYPSSSLSTVLPPPPSTPRYSTFDEATKDRDTAQSSSSNLTSSSSSAHGPQGSSSSSSGISSSAASTAQSMYEEDKYRKIFINLRKKLRPHDIAIRCRIFEGVISGSDITGWITTKSGIAGVEGMSTTASEVIGIAQGLLDSGLIVAVSCGYEADEDDDMPIGSFSSSSTHSSVSTRFSDRSGYVYRFKEGSSASSFSCTVMGALTKTRVSMWQKVGISSGSGLASGGAGAVGGGGNFTERESTLDFSTSTKEFVEYFLDINHGGCQWGVWRRYREFEQFSKGLLSLGIRPETSFPSKSFKILAGDEATETRRVGLDAYLSSAIEAIAQSLTRTPSAGDLAAQFLDDKHNKLRLCHEK